MRNQISLPRHVARVLSVIVHISKIVNTFPTGTTTRNSVHRLSQHYCSTTPMGFLYCTRSSRNQWPKGNVREDLLPARRTLRTTSDITHSSRLVSTRSIVTRGPVLLIEKALKNRLHAASDSSHCNLVGANIGHPSACTRIQHVCRDKPRIQDLVLAAKQSIA